MSEWYSQIISNLSSWNWSYSSSYNNQNFFFYFNNSLSRFTDHTLVDGYFIYWLLIGLIVFKITLSIFNYFRKGVI